MSYTQYETGEATGHPVELYHFRSGFANYFYTNAKIPVLADGYTYEPLQIDRGTIVDSPELGRTGVSIEVPFDSDVAKSFITSPPDEIMWIDIYAVHLTDPLLNTVQMWRGRVLNITWKNEMASMYVESAITSLRRLGARVMYQKTCPYQLYGSGCNVSQDAFKSVGVLASLSGVDAVLGGGISIPSDGYYTGGYLQWSDISGIHRSYVVQQIGSVFTLQYRPVGLVGGISVDAFPGCDRTITTCQNKFNNVLNCLALPYIPAENPFVGRIV